MDNTSSKIIKAHKPQLEATAPVLSTVEVTATDHVPVERFVEGVEAIESWPRERRQLAGSLCGTMPLAALLPSLGDVAELARFKKRFTQRLEKIRGGDGEELTARGGEEGMLTQVLQWLSLGEAP